MFFSELTQTIFKYGDIQNNNLTTDKELTFWTPSYAIIYSSYKLLQHDQLSQRDRAAGCVIVLAKTGRLELGDNILRTL